MASRLWLEVARSSCGHLQFDACDMYKRLPSDELAQGECCAGRCALGEVREMRIGAQKSQTSI